MKWVNKIGLSIMGVFLMAMGLGANGFTDASVKMTYSMPEESAEHEGTWLQWPHRFTYGASHLEKLEPIWVAMTEALAAGERVHIIVYNQSERTRVKQLLTEEANVDMQQIDFHVFKTDDVWVRDNGPIFAYDAKGKLTLLNWGFNGWGNKTPYKHCAEIPKQISEELDLPLVDLKALVLEGGAIEMDGGATGLSTRSSVINKNRNSKLSEAKIDATIKKVYGLKKIIWLDGVVGEDITDFHIDGFARFLNSDTLITMNAEALSEWGLSDKDINTLLHSKNAAGKSYKKIELPLTQNQVILENGKDLGYPGSYLNFYVGNAVVLVPNYNDPMDAYANKIIQKLYPDREIVGIDIRELYQDGGMIHCVTQQQPVAHSAE